MTKAKDPKRQFESFVKFFATVGDQIVDTHQFGDHIYSVSVEEMYQHFKARLLAEIEADADADDEGEEP